MGLFDDALGGVTNSFSDLVDDVLSGDVAGILSSAVDLAGEVMETAAPVVGLFNPAAGAALAVGGSVFDAIEDGNITQSEVYNIGSTVLNAVGLGGAIGSGLEVVAGVNAIAEQQAFNIFEKILNGEEVTQGDVDLLGRLINILNTEEAKGSSGKGKKGGAYGAEGGGAAGAEGADASGGQSIFELFASILGKKMGESLQKMQDVAKEIADIDNSATDDVGVQKAGNILGQKVPQFTAASQEFSFLSQSFNTAINALGEGLKAAARKQ